MLARKEYFSRGEEGIILEGAPGGALRGEAEERFSGSKPKNFEAPLNIHLKDAKSYDKGTSKLHRIREREPKRLPLLTIRRFEISRYIPRKNPPFAFLLIHTLTRIQHT